MHLTPHAILCNPSSFILHVDFIPSHSSQFGDIELHLIPIPCHQCNIIAHTEFMTTYITNHFIEIACQDLSKFIIHNPWITPLIQIHSFISYFINAYQEIHISQNSIHPQINECQHLSTWYSIQSSTTHNHNSYTKIPKKIYYHETKITAVMRDTFLKLQTSNRRSNR